MSMRPPLARARGLGSAKDGVSHFWWQRLTGLALVPITFWFVGSVVSLAGTDYAHFRAWLSHPGNTTMMILLIFAAFHHAHLGMQTVIEDYVHDEGVKLFSVIALKFAAFLFGVFSAVAVLRVALVGG
ncbi:MAG TPA: succinate dehydrogenase, hydrophobic membrane anchor protein [Rhodospirillaceae bacterium]|nr:succinate dehydrogenase, hydrophobic membrane anchor protein [Rhodospirillaceae bacterium]